MEKTTSTSCTMQIAKKKEPRKFIEAFFTPFHQVSTISMASTLRATAFGSSANRRMFASKELMAQELAKAAASRFVGQALEQKREV